MPVRWMYSQTGEVARQEAKTSEVEVHISSHASKTTV